MIASKTASLRQARTFGRLVMASAIGVGGLPGEAAPVDESMARYRWKYRGLGVSAPSGTDTRLGTQHSIVAGHRNGLRERDLVVITVAGDHVASQLGPEPNARAAALRARFGVKPCEFPALLVGKDCGVKISSTVPISAERLFRTIDAMPMRQNETRRRAGR